MIGKTKTLLAVSIVLASAFVCVTMNHDDETDAVFEWGAFAAGFAVGAVSGGAAVYMIDQLLSENRNNLEAAWREASAEKIQTIVAITDADAVTALKNYAQIWGYTSEHFQRQSELAAAMTWGPDKGYDPESIMLYSGTYENSSMMLGNAVAQINKVWSSLSASLDSHNEDDTYAGKMTFSWTYGGQSFGSTEHWDGTSVYVASVPEGMVLKAYIASGGTLYRDGVAVGSFDEGKVVAMDSGIWSSDRMLPVIDADAADIHAGMIVRAGSDCKTLWYDGNVIVDGVRYNDLSVTIGPKGSESRSAEITDELSSREMLLNAVKSTIVKASSSASAVWSIYNDAGHASSYLTTLTVPNVYENVSLTTEQRNIMTVLSLQQLSSYWQSSGELKKTYSVTGGSNLLFIRGDIRDASGTLIAEDAIFTPYYMTDDDTVSVGSNVQTQSSICAVWTTGYTGNLSAWSGDAGSKASLIETSTGFTFDIAEILYDGRDVSSVELRISGMDYIDGKEIGVDPTPHRDVSSAIDTVLFVIGLIMLLFGLISGRMSYAIVGVLVLLVAIIGFDTIKGGVL